MLVNNNNNNKNELDSDLEIGFIDDLYMLSDLLTLAKDAETVVQAKTSTGLKRNTAKCEFILDDFTNLSRFPSLRGSFAYPRTTWLSLELPFYRGTHWMKHFKSK